MVGPIYLTKNLTVYNSTRMHRFRRPFKIYQTNTQTATDNVGQAQ